MSTTVFLAVGLKKAIVYQIRERCRQEAGQLGSGQQSFYFFHKMVRLLLL